MVSKIPNWAPQSQGHGPRCKFTPWPLTPALEVRDLAAGPRRFPEGLLPLHCQGSELPVAASCPPKPSDQRGP